MLGHCRLMRISNLRLLRCRQDTPANDLRYFTWALALVTGNITGTMDDTAFYAMFVTSSAAALFYIAVTVVGIVLLLNLVIATLFNRFSFHRKRNHRHHLFIGAHQGVSCAVLVVCSTAACAYL
jgi:hypothetical protein